MRSRRRLNGEIIIPASKRGLPALLPLQEELTKARVKRGKVQLPMILCDIFFRHCLSPLFYFPGIFNINAGVGGVVIQEEALDKAAEEALLLLSSSGQAEVAGVEIVAGAVVALVAFPVVVAFPAGAAVLPVAVEPQGVGRKLQGSW